MRLLLNKMINHSFFARMIEKKLTLCLVFKLVINFQLIFLIFQIIFNTCLFFAIDNLKKFITL